MNTLNYGNNWGNLFILAHEVGHHINGHSLDLVLYAADAVESVSLAQSRQQELEADEFAGFVLARLGGPISSANEVISKISKDSDDSYNTHPSRDKRLKATAKGYNNASINNNSKPNELIIFEGVLTSKEAIDIYQNGEKSELEGNLYDAISFYSKSAKLNYIFSFFKMAMVKLSLGDENGALNDLNLYINNGGKYPWAFNERARIYYNKGLYIEALNDYKSVLYYDPNGEFVSNPYYSIGHCRASLGDMDGACKEWKIASEKGNKFAANDILKYCH
ncbi:MAG: M48 family metalloprotease [Schleiferiaceae bacterium]|jgi:tetratricopeptide (TPR) repeat protein